MILLRFLIIGFCTLSTSQAIFFQRSYIQEKPVRSEYDFVVVGSGSAGSVIANRLSEERGWNVLLLEVGRRPTIFSEVPVLAAYLQFTDYNWAYVMEHTPHACQGFVNQRCVWPRGKGLGGSTLINYMIYTRGNKKDFDQWASAGNPGWSYDEVLPYFKKSENAHLRYQDANYHGFAGPLSVEDVNYRSTLAHSFIGAGRELGYKYIDYNGRTQNGFSYVQANTKNGRRASADKAFVNPAERRGNLDVLTESRATKILINPISKEAYGVEFVKNRRYHYVNFTKEVILSAGALSSPQLLMLSGVGPKKHLQRLGIPVIQDLPVGKNLQDHITFLGLVYEVNSSVALSQDELAKPQNIYRWLMRGEGPFTSLGGVEGIGYMHTNISQNFGAPDIEFILLTADVNEDFAELFKKMFSVSDEVYDKYYKSLKGKHVWTLLPMLLHPKSVGHLELKSRNPYHWPRFYGNYLSDKENIDVKTFVAAIREIQRLSKTQAFQKYGSKTHSAPLPGCEMHRFDSDEYWECCVRHVSNTLHHQVGTCKMGPPGDGTAVVDNQLRVHGIRRLRVADTSVIPFALSSHTNAPAFMVGEKAADYIKQGWTGN